MYLQDCESTVEFPAGYGVVHHGLDPLRCFGDEFVGGGEVVEYFGAYVGVEGEETVAFGGGVGYGLEGVIYGGGWGVVGVVVVIGVEELRDGDGEEYDGEEDGEEGDLG